MKLERFKERDNKRMGIIVFTIVCILLVSGVILYRTFAIFEVKTNQNVIKGTVQDPGNIYFAFYVNDGNEDKIQKEMPNKESGLVLDENKSYCGVNGEKNDKITVSLTEDWRILVSGVTTSRTKCNLYFTQGILIMGHGVPVVENGDGLYEVTHEDVNKTVNDKGFQQTEWRYAGKTEFVKNFVEFNDELWRIIGLVNVMTSETDVEQRIKIVRKESIGNYAWDRNENYTNDWTNSKLMEMLNNGYYNSLSEVECYTGEDPFMSNKSICDFSGNGTQPKGLNVIAKNYIEENIIWTLGGGDTYFNVDDFYEIERSTSTGNNNQFPSLWKSSENTQAKIGLIYISDYGYATSGGSMEKKECSEKNIREWNNDECSNSDWLKPKNTLWALVPTTSQKDWSYYIEPQGYCGNIYSCRGPSSIYPTLYLKNNVKIIDGLGTEENPYKLALVS